VAQYIPLALGSAVDLLILTGLAAVLLGRRAGRAARGAIQSPAVSTDAPRRHGRDGLTFKEGRHA
jgi:hypothetical protein